MEEFMGSFGLVAWVVIPALLIVFLTLFISKQYKKCPSDQLLVIYGGMTGTNGVKCIPGGAAFVVPFFQGYNYMELVPMQLDIPLQSALSSENIRVNVPSSFTIAISADPIKQVTAAKRFLRTNRETIKEQASDVIFGQLRQVIASMKIEEINNDREKFQKKINTDVAEELEKLGLDLINVNIKDITDESEYLESRGKQAAEAAKQEAERDVAEQQKIGQIAKAELDREREVEVARANADTAIGKAKAKKDEDVSVASFNAERVKGQNESKAQEAEYNADLKVKEAEAFQRSETKQAEAQKAVYEKEKETKIAELRKSEVAEEEIRKEKLVIQAKAKAEQEEEEAKGHAAAIKNVADAKAHEVNVMLTKKAEGWEKLIKAAGDADKAAKLLLVEQMPEIVREQMSALKELEIGDVTVWDSGSSNGSGGGLKGFLKDYMTMTPAMMHLGEQVGIELPQLLGMKVPKDVEVDNDTLEEKLDENSKVD